MKQALLFLICFLGFQSVLLAQLDDNQPIDTSKIYIVIKNDASFFVGKIKSIDAHEILMHTKTVGEVAIPKHEVKEIRLAKANEVDAKGNLKTAERFATRYFLNTNALPLEKGESYALWALYGPDFQFAVSDKIGVGIMTTWLATPLVANVKYSMTINDISHLGIGLLVGSMSWSSVGSGLALPFATYTLGDRRNNISFSAGYGTVWSNGTSSGRFLCSLNALTKVSNKVSLVFDSFIIPGGGSNDFNLTLLMPGIRVQTAKNNSFQFGFASISENSSQFAALPIPFVEWFQAF
jgi:ribosome maturation factor RimP